MPGSSPFHYCFNNPLILRDPSGLIGEIGGDGIPRFTTGEVVCEADGPWHHWWSNIEGARRGNEWMNGQGAARMGNPTAADRVAMGAKESGGVAVDAGDPTYNNLNNAIGAFSIGWSTKELMIKGAVAGARGVSLANVKNLHYIRALGTGGAVYMNVVKQIGKGTAALGAVVTLGDGLVNGFQTHHAADLAIQGAIYGIGASIPVAGWIIGGGYVLGDLYFQSTHNGMSITQYYLDKKR
jgi:hypothetical protein